MGHKRFQADTVRDIIIYEDLRHNYLRPPQKMGAQRCGRLAITSPRGEGDPNIIDQSCLALYEEQKCTRGVRQFYLKVELFTHLDLRPWFRMEVKTHCQKGLRA